MGEEPCRSPPQDLSNRKYIQIQGGSIKATGPYTAQIRLHREVIVDFEFEVVVIGAGIVGLAIAYELSKTFYKILVIEKESTFGQHISSRNSEVIHSGFYYPKDSLKKKLCVKGNKLLYNFLEKYECLFLPPYTINKIDPTKKS